ncbi:MAG: ATP-dependent dethiobiotin synthetase BioD [Acidimicrobiia bacterium]
MTAAPRPDRLVVVLGTGTEVGKTWVSCRILDRLRVIGSSVAAWKPAQSFDPEAVVAGARSDAELLAAACGSEPDLVCPPHRSYPIPLAPPMASERLGAGEVRLAELLAEQPWRPGTDVGLVEGAGGSRSPIAHDADGNDLARALAPDLVVLVADAGLGTLHAVRSALEGLDDLPTVVLLNRYDGSDALHQDNRRWLAERFSARVVTAAGVAAYLSTPSGSARPARLT